MSNNQQREELHRTIWAMADELRGAVDGWDFKAYVLGSLFYRFISENLTNYINRLQEEAGIEGFDYADMSDEDAEMAREQMVQEKGFFILPSQLFKNVCANVDFYSGFVYTMLGIPEELFTPIFAIARIAGWSAHRLEEIINAGKIIRPAYKYVGEHTEFQEFEERE